MFRNALIFVVLLASFSTVAKTPGEVYEQAAKSTVVVRSINIGGSSQSMGSGVILPNRDVVTNCHVVKGASQLKVRVGNKDYPATLRYSDWDRDICSLIVSGVSAPVVVVGSTKTLKIGAKVYAIGAPQGLELTLSDGIVSNLREVEGGRYIQSTAAISPGSSGGGLFDENGALVGLTTFYLAEGQNLNFAVPVEWINELPKRSTKITTAAQPVTQWLNKAIELESRKDWSGLLEHTTRWTKAQPGSRAAWYCLGISYAQIGQSAKAIEAYQQALRLDPDYAVVWANLGATYSELGQIAKAIDAHQQALRIDPEDVKAWTNLGVAYADSGQFTKAIECHQQALRITPEQAETWGNLGVAYYGADQPAKGVEAFQEALRINPKYAKAWYNLGVAFSVPELRDKAIGAFMEAVRINPEYADAWYNLGVNYAKKGQRDSVLEVYKRIKALDPALAERFFNKFVIP